MPSLRPGSAWFSVLCAALACGSPSPGDPAAPPTPKPPPAAYAPTALQQRLAELPPQKPLVASDKQKQLAALLDAFHQRSATTRSYIHTDKPLYQPGETIWLRVWELQTQSMAAGPGGHGVRIELVSPKGATVIDKRVRADAGLVTNDLVLPPDVQGGEYIIRTTSDRGEVAERAVIVSSYQPPQIKKKLEFLRKAYGAGDTVTAALEVHRNTGEPVANSELRVIASVDDVEIRRFAVTTDASGAATVKLELPDRIARGDGLLTVLVDEGGVTESIQKRIPIVVKDLQVELFPEGGELVEGLPGRVYVSAKNPLGKPADVRARVVDDRGVVVANVVTLHDGMGRFDLTPAVGRRYRLEIDKPVGIARTYEIPAAQSAGCALQAVDDPHGKRAEVRVGVWCTEARTIIGTATLRERRLGDVAVGVVPGMPSVVAVPVPAGSQGAVRITIMSDDLAPLAERLVYVHRGADLAVTLRPTRKSYTPREEVTLAIETRDPSGRPVAADLALAVVDDTVLSFADDKTANILARTYLEAEMPGQVIEEPNFYFGDDDKAPYALDLVLGTQGWRRFDWQAVLSPPPPIDEVALPMAAMGAPMEEAEGFADDEDRGPRNMPVPRPAMAPPPAPPPAGPARAEAKPEPDLVARRPMPLQQEARGGALGRRDRRQAVEKDKAWGAKIAADEPAWAWAPVRTFPAPNYGKGDVHGPRNDFRETIFWQAQVKTDDEGRGEARFYLSDAVTSFRATAEGVTAGGSVGRGDALVQSKLPVSLAVKMPNEVSSGDTVLLPVTLANETREREDATLEARFGPAFRVKTALPKSVTLDAGERRTFHAELEVVGNGAREADGAMAIRMNARNLSDEIEKTVRVSALGFPQEQSLAGTLDKTARHELRLGKILPGSLKASVTLYPSPVASMMQGMEAILAEPHGCFEQTSSSNYPNIMVLAYLDAHDSADPQVVAKAAGMLERGYKRLVGYETKEKGYEWFGSAPGHEALSAYGLLEFADMKAVYPDVDDTMVQRTRAWLRSRRDGKGGYKRNDRALDSFGAASPEVTNAYITYALSEAGERDLAAELAVQKRLAAETRDPYLLALATGTLFNLEPNAASTRAAVNRLLAMQGKDGSFPGADHSITRSGGQALEIETTSLALLALLDAGPDHMVAAGKAAQWINTQRSGLGGYGSTQSTILALKSLTQYADRSRVTRSSGMARVRINGRLAGTVSFQKGHEGALPIDGLEQFLRAGDNHIELELDSESQLPYSVQVSYRTELPPSSPGTAVAVTTSMARTQVPVGEGSRLDVLVENTTQEGQPMTVARVGIPGGMRFQTWQLKELKDKGLIGFYETHPREVVLYFRDLAPSAKMRVPLELIAEVPGRFVAPSSRAYLYYTDELVSWAPPITATITR